MVFFLGLEVFQVHQRDRGLTLSMLFLCRISSWESKCKSSIECCKWTYMQPCKALYWLLFIASDVCIALCTRMAVTKSAKFVDCTSNHVLHDEQSLHVERVAMFGIQLEDTFLVLWMCLSPLFTVHVTIFIFVLWGDVFHMIQ